MKLFARNNMMMQMPMCMCMSCCASECRLLSLNALAE